MGITKQMNEFQFHKGTIKTDGDYGSQIRAH